MKSYYASTRTVHYFNLERKSMKYQNAYKQDQIEHLYELVSLYLLYNLLYLTLTFYLDVKFH